MGFPGGTHSVFTRAFRAKRELQCIFLGKRRALLHPKTAQRSFFLITIFFLGKLKEKLARKCQVFEIVLMPPGHPIILLKSS